MRVLKSKVPRRSYSSPNIKHNASKAKSIEVEPCHGRRKAACDGDCAWTSGKGCADKNPRRYFSGSAALDDDRRKFCRCVLHVMRQGHPNPYAVCARSVGTTTGGRSCQYNMRSIPLSEVKAYMLYLHNVGKLNKSNIALQKLIKWF